MKRKIIIGAWIGFFSAIFGIVLLAIMIEKGWVGYMPPLEELSNPIDKYATQIYSTDGKLLGTWSQNENRIFAEKDSISPYVFKALIATEDVRFNEHSGIDFRAAFRAVIKRGLLRQKSAGGGSTITQQLAKQLYSKVAKSTFKRLLQKPIEWAIAVEIERYYTKDEILTLYLNYFDFLYNAVGITTASRVYFNKKPSELNLLESATLVGMCKNPAYFNPVRNIERARNRRNVVLQQMEKAGYITAAQEEELAAKPVEINFHRIDHKVGMAPYLREYLRTIMMADKPDRSQYNKWQGQEFYEDSIAWENSPLYGWCKKNRKRDGSNYNIYTDGLKVYTTIDSRMQEAAEHAMIKNVGIVLQRAFNNEKRGARNYPFYSGTSQRQVSAILNRSVKQSERYERMKADGKSEEEIKAAFKRPIRMQLFSFSGKVDTIMSPLDSIKYYKAFLRSALISLEANTGFVRAYVGGLNYAHFQYDMAVKGRRQVGSTIKPFVYALAMEDGLTPYDTIINEQRTYGNWSPRNGSRSHYGEPMPISWGLTQSNNWMTANLMAKIDPSGKRLRDFLRKFGVSTLDIYPSMALCLGTCGITVSELASAYTAFVNQGIRSAPIFVTRIEDSKGNVIARFAPRQSEVMGAVPSYNVLEMLQGVVNNGTGVRLRYRYKFTCPLAGKTGTTNNNSDGWFVGITPQLVTACWVGGDDPSIHFNSMAYGQGAASALPVFADYLRLIYSIHDIPYSASAMFAIPAEVRQSMERKKAAEEFTDSVLSNIDDYINEIAD